MILQRLSPNTQGRDFVIGDVHGTYTVLQNLLANLRFDPAVDRLISVGDLVDRGPDSLSCLALLKEPWFFCVKANHEELMLSAFDRAYLGDYWIPNGGAWGITALHESRMRYASNELDRITPSPSSVQLWDLLPLARELPYIITIERPDGKLFHVIHAELPFGMVPFDITDETLSTPDKVQEIVSAAHRHERVCMWGRFMLGRFYKADLSNEQKIKRTVAYTYKNHNPFRGLSHIISGHTIMQRPLTVLGQTCIDTGAFMLYDTPKPKWAGLTCVELGTWTFYTATETEFREVQPLEVNTTDVDLLSKGHISSLGMDYENDS